MPTFVQIFEKLSDAKLVSVAWALDGLLSRGSDSIYYVAWSVAAKAVREEMVRRGLARDHGVSGSPLKEDSHNGTEGN